VLDILNNKQLEAAKRAAMITTALKWLLDRIPVKLFPPQFRPILMMLKRLAPYLGYIGVFIAWSWSAIKAFDKGMVRAHPHNITVVSLMRFLQETELC
jgi:hypothetical protein